MNQNTPPFDQADQPADERRLLRRVAMEVLSRTPPRLFHVLRVTPYLGDALLRAIDAMLPRPVLLRKRIRRGPLRGMVLDIDPRALDMVIARYEPRIQAILEQHLRAGDIAFDVGANVGYFALVMAKCVAPNGQVLAFEPDPVVAAGLMRNVRRNADLVAPVIPVAAAAGAARGRAAFARGRRATRGKLVEGGGDFEVELTTVDDAARRFGAPRLLKIDVEGAELDVLAGAGSVLEGSRPIVVLEVHSDDLERRCTALLQGFGYECERWVERGRGEAHIVAR